MTNQSCATPEVRILRVQNPVPTGVAPVPFPRYQTTGAAAFDLAANLPDGPRIIAPGSVELFDTGFIIVVPSGYVGLICCRSGIAVKNKVVVVNSPGVLDADFRDSCKVALYNASDTSYTVTHGARIAQMIVTAAPQAKLVQVESLEETERGTGGFGSTGGF